MLDGAPSSENTPGDEAEIFCKAVMVGELEVIESAIENGVDVNAVGADGTPPIVLAAARSDLDTAKLLVDAGADVNRPDSMGGMCALHAAATHGNEEMVRVFCAKGADPNAAYGDPPITPIVIAVRGDDLPVLKALLDAGGNPNTLVDAEDDDIDERGKTAVCLAAMAGNARVLELLVDYGADVNRATNAGMTPLMAATFVGSVDTVQLLLRAGCEDSNEIP